MIFNAFPSPPPSPPPLNHHLLNTAKQHLNPSKICDSGRDRDYGDSYIIVNHMIIDITPEERIMLLQLIDRFSRGGELPWDVFNILESLRKKIA